MNSHENRIAWLESDLRTLTSRLESLEQIVSSEKWNETRELKKLRRGLEDDIRDLRSDLAREQHGLYEYRKANEQDKHHAFSFVGVRLAWHQLALSALGMISLVEAIAIIVLWRR